MTGVILLIALFLMISRNANGLNSIRRISLVSYSYLEEPLAKIRVYRQALQTNEQLQRKNIQLQDELSKLRSVQAENQALKAMVGYRDSSTYPLYPVRIIGKNLSSINNSITIDAGTDDGVDVGMALVTGEGLVGRVILSSTGYSEVMPIMNNVFRVSARIQGSRTVGLVQWDGLNYDELTMYYVPKSIQVDSGAVVETSGYSLEFPSQIPIGVVHKTVVDEGSETQKIFITPSVSLFQIAEAFVVTAKQDTALVNLQLKKKVK
jgi:rod shape-determining protein MreC